MLLILNSLNDFSHLINIFFRVCAPLEYCPPEWFDASKKAEGVAFDTWLYGLMTLQVLTGHWPNQNMNPVRDARSWKKNVEPVLKKALKVMQLFLFQ